MKSAMIPPTGTSLYSILKWKPKINGHTLEGDKSSSELGLPEVVQELWTSTDKVMSQKATTEALMVIDWGTSIVN